jgi:hypothetical protein
MMRLIVFHLLPFRPRACWHLPKSGVNFVLESAVTIRGTYGAERSPEMDDEQRTPSREEQAKVRRRKILDRLNSVDTGVSRYDREQEERRARGIDIVREKDRRPEPGSFGGSGG